MKRRGKRRPRGEDVAGGEGVGGVAEGVKTTESPRRKQKQQTTVGFFIAAIVGRCRPVTAPSVRLRPLHLASMDRYQRVEKPKSDTPINENEIRVTIQGVVRNYINYAISLLQHLGNANLSGKLVSQLGQLPNLQYMELYNNNISGKVSPELGNLTNLVSLDLYLNKLDGTTLDTLVKFSRLCFLNAVKLVEGNV